MYTNTWTGTGIGVAILDTGLYPHIDFGERIRGFQDFLGHRPYPYDDSGHGTHVAGIPATEQPVTDAIRVLHPGVTWLLQKYSTGVETDAYRMFYGHSSGSLSIRTSMEYESSIFLWALPQRIQKLQHD